MTTSPPDEESAAHENRRLRRTMRDLVALSTLPAIWVGLDSRGILRSLADVLQSTLSLDLVYVRLASRPSEVPIEVVRSKRGSASPIEVEAVRASLAPLIRSPEPSPSPIPDPFGVGALRVAVTRFGVGDDRAILVTGSRAEGFPTEQDRLLLGLGANQTAIVIQRRRAEEQTRAQAERLRVTLASIGDAVLTTDGEGRITFLNTSAESLSGWTHAEAAGRPVWKRSSRSSTSASAPRWRIRLVRSSAKGRPWAGRITRFSSRRTGLNGSSTPVPRRSSAVRGRPRGCVLVFRDITEKRKAEENLRKGGRAGTHGAGEHQRSLLRASMRSGVSRTSTSRPKRSWRARKEIFLARFSGTSTPVFGEATSSAPTDTWQDERVAESFTSYYPDHARWYEDRLSGDGRDLRLLPRCQRTKQNEKDSGGVPRRGAGGASLAEEMQRRNVESLFNEAPAPIALMRGPDFLLEFVNPQCAKMLGLAIRSPTSWASPSCRHCPSSASKASTPSYDK